MKKVFARKENKYLLSWTQYEKLREKTASYLEEDEYGLHTISSIYYDTADFHLIRQSIEKPRYKEKFRLRTYGTPQDDSLAFLEIKKKYYGVVYKRRICLDYLEALTYRSGDPLHLSEKDQQIKREIDWVLTRYQLSPAVLIAYDRRALQPIGGFDPDFRITFDFDMRFRDNDLDVRKGSGGTLIDPQVDVLMEVKALGAYPLWFTAILAELRIYQASFSKYAQTYQKHLEKTLFVKEEIIHVI